MNPRAWKNVCARLSIAFLIGISGFARSPVPSSQDLDDLTEGVRIAIQEGDRSRAVELMRAQGEAQEVATLYDSVAGNLYRSGDIDEMIVVAQAGIDYSLSESIQAEMGQDLELAEELQRAAKVLAFNLGSNTWPGWDAPGIEITPSHLAVGFEAARLNLRLGLTLRRGPEPMATAYWLLGAHALAAGEVTAATEFFGESAEIARQADIRSAELLAQGFEAMAVAITDPQSDRGEVRLNRVKESFRSENIDDADFWIDQLDTAYRVFVVP